MTIRVVRSVANMVTGITQNAGKVGNVALETVLERIHKSREGCQDVEVKAKEMHFNPNGCVSVAGEVFSFTQWSFGQWCAKLKVPTDFMRRCPATDVPAGQKAIFDFWKERIDDKRLVLRLKKHETVDAATGAIGRIRAVLTDRYSVFDNHDLMDVLAPVIQDQGLVIQRANLTDQSFHLRLLWPDQIEVGKLPNGEPDLHNVGYHQMNSEVGYRNLQGDMLVFRQVCTNGLIALHEKEHLFYMKHIGLKRVEIRNALTIAMENILSRRNEVIDVMERAQGQRLPGTEAEALIRAQRNIASFLRNNHGTDEFVHQALEAFNREPVPTRFGVVQAITAAARSLPMDARVEMEEAAGLYLMAA